MITASQIRDKINGLLDSFGVACVAYRGAEKFLFSGVGGNRKMAQTDDFGSGGIRETTKVVCSDEVPFVPEIGYSIDVAGIRYAVVSVSQSPCGGNWTLGLSQPFDVRVTATMFRAIDRATPANTAGSSFSLFVVWNDGDIVNAPSGAWIQSGDADATLFIRSADWPGDSAPDGACVFTRDNGQTVTSTNVVRTPYGWRISAKERRT